MTIVGGKKIMQKKNKQKKTKNKQHLKKEKSEKNNWKNGIQHSFFLRGESEPDQPKMVKVIHENCYHLSINIDLSRSVVSVTTVCVCVCVCSVCLFVCASVFFVYVSVCGNVFLSGQTAGRILLHKCGNASNTNQNCDFLPS